MGALAAAVDGLDELAKPTTTATTTRAAARANPERDLRDDIRPLLLLFSQAIRPPVRELL
jgi:hypothetical protein